MITEKRAALLEALGLYGYLTPQQMLFSLGLFSDENSLRSALDAMKRQGLVSSCKPWPILPRWRSRTRVCYCKPSRRRPWRSANG